MKIIFSIALLACGSMLLVGCAAVHVQTDPPCSKGNGDGDCYFIYLNCDGGILDGNSEGCVKLDHLFVERPCGTGVLAGNSDDYYCLVEDAR